MARNNYYNNDYSPHCFFDGNVDGGSSPGTWQARIDNEIDVDAPVIIELWGYYNEDSLAGRIYVRLITESSPGLNNIKLRVALTESRISWHAPNNTNIHNQTFRDMVPSTGGQAVTLVVGDTLEYSFPFTTNSPINPEECELVAFVQADQNRRMLQAAKISLLDLTSTAIDDEPGIPVIFALSQNYPNPFNAKTLINFSLPQAGDVDISIYSITGQLVETLGGNFEAGRQSVTWDASSAVSGVYFYKVSSGNLSQTMKMTLLK